MLNNEKITTEEKPEMNWFTLFIGAVLGFALACLLFFFYHLGRLAEQKKQLAEKNPLDDMKPMKDITLTSTSKTTPAILEDKSPVIPSAIQTVPAPLKTEIPLYSHSETFNVVNWNGKKFELTTNQSRVMEKLWKAFDNRVPEMHQGALLEGLDIYSKRIQDVFKNNVEAFKVFFARGQRKGTFRLNLS
jgi:hypothetical protein